MAMALYRRGTQRRKLATAARADPRVGPHRRPRPCGCVIARVSVEEASTLGWSRYVGSDGHSVGLDTFGALAPLKQLQSKFGFVPENVVVAAKQQIERAR
jgi:hypothetical protein